MTLPWLESLQFATAASTGDQPRPATLVTFTGMGFHSNHWWAKGEGAAMELGPCLTPLRALARADGLHQRPVERTGKQRRDPLYADGEHAQRCRPCRRPKSARASVSTSCWHSGSASRHSAAIAGARLRRANSGPPGRASVALQLAHFVEHGGVANLDRRRGRPWLSTNSSAPSPTAATAVSLMPCSKTPGRYVSDSPSRTVSDSRSISAAFTRSRVASNGRGRSERPAVGSRA